MTNVLVRQDIDGKLYHCPSEPPGHYAKALSTDVAWHVYEPVDLQDAADGVVQSVAFGGEAQRTSVGGTGFGGSVELRF